MLHSDINLIAVFNTQTKYTKHECFMMLQETQFQRLCYLAVHEGFTFQKMSVFRLKK